MTTATTDMEQRRPGRLAAIKIRGLEPIARHHGRNSAQYRRACSLFKQVISAVYLAFTSQSSSRQPKLVVVNIPHSSSSKVLKRSVSSLLSDFSVHKRAPPANFGPVIPSSQRSFDSFEACTNQTDACTGHGTCVEAIQGGRKGVWACSCRATTRRGKTVSWSGSVCQKEDISRYDIF
jgi:hypothetical protein